MTTMMQIYQILETDTHEAVKSTPSSMNYTFENMIEYRKYLLSMSFYFTLKDTLGWSILVYGGSEERINGTLNVVDSDIL